MNSERHIYPMHDKLLNREEKERFLNQKAGVFWLTGLSGSGKSTIAAGVEKKLFSMGYLVQILDGDNIRTGISNNLTFSLADRKENIRRISEVSKLLINCGIICINSFVSPTNDIRDLAKSIIGEEDFHLIHIAASLAACEKRDVKGLYKKAREGKIQGFTGIDSPFEMPNRAELVIETESNSISESINQLSDYICRLI